MKVLLVEDDDVQAEWLCEELEQAFGLAPLWIATESKFRSRLDEIAASRPNVAVIDVMLRWTLPSPDMLERPEDARDIYAAGFRCRKLLAEREGTRNVPVIFYSVLNREDLEAKLQGLSESVTYLQKDSDAAPLIRRIREVVPDERRLSFAR